MDAVDDPEHAIWALSYPLFRSPNRCNLDFGLVTTGQSRALRAELHPYGPGFTPEYQYCHAASFPQTLLAPSCHPHFPLGLTIRLTKERVRHSDPALQRVCQTPPRHHPPRRLFAHSHRGCSQMGECSVVLDALTPMLRGAPDLTSPLT